MMILAALAFGVALQQPAQQPRPATVRPQVTVQTQQQASSPSHPLTPFDSTVGALSDVGTKVAEVRSTYELYRRAAFNEPDGALIERANLYRSNLRTLMAAIVEAQHRICRSCLPRSVQPAVDQYRANLPALSRTAEQSAARIAQLKSRGSTASVATAMRADVRAEGERLMMGTRTYEARVADVRRVMGWDQTPPVPTPRRGS